MPPALAPQYAATDTTADGGVWEFQWSRDEFDLLLSAGVLDAAGVKLRGGLIWQVEAGEAMPHLWNREQYHAAIEAGVFASRGRVELIEGRIYEMAAVSVEHVVMMENTYEWLRVAFEHRVSHLVRMQVPAGVIGSEPEPDVWVVRGAGSQVQQKRDLTPDDLVLAVEVSNRTLSHDRNKKRRLYAAFGLRDFWLIDVVKRVLEVRRQPALVDGNWNYRELRYYRGTETVSPLARPGVEVQVDRLLDGED